MIHECTNSGCKSKGMIEKDLNSTVVTCGVVGISSAKNIRVIDGKVFCATCSSTIYEEI